VLRMNTVTLYMGSVIEASNHLKRCQPNAEALPGSNSVIGPKHGPCYF
jgi:hypothetical protein